MRAVSRKQLDSSRVPQPSVPVTVRAATPLPPAEAFAPATMIDLTVIFRGLGPLPAVIAIRDQSGPWDHVGAHRNPVLSDGTTAHEEITDNRPPSYFAYEVSGFTNILGRFVTGARGEWTFIPASDGGTVITWTYTFRPLERRTAAVRLLIAPLWAIYMRRALAATVKELQRQYDLAGRSARG